MDFGALTKKLVSDAILKQIPGLNRKVDFKLFVSQGAYNSMTDSYETVWNTITGVVVVGISPTYDEVTTLDVKATDMKLLVAGTSLPSVPQVDTDKVIIDGAEWDVKKTKEVPGGSLISVFVRLT